MNYTAAAGQEAGKGHQDFTVSFSFLKESLPEKGKWAVQFLNKETYGRRHANYLQRLWAGIYLQCCRSSVFSRTRLLDPEAMQTLPPSKEKRTGRFRLPFGSFTGNTCDLFGLWPADHRSFRAARGSAGILPVVLHRAERHQGWVAVA
ncbi:hypothetical protein SBA5_450071 [Candidatus Sulfotelmatomonas gaucii]|uniref:Uncharacterized protein n=1 Tax=Candidatus Sulfuritelmatomonas gaucii TaxID=2043161 RepID=A0A2N9LMD2_9BACT|nr:hypothetical protein SBA5_450071 [Candidatus Sulfotelmatomonas gaucii]